MIKIIKPPDKLLVKFLRLVAAISGIFALLLCTLMIITFIQLTRTDPLNTPVLPQLQKQLNQEGEDLPEEINEWF